MVYGLGFRFKSHTLDAGVASFLRFRQTNQMTDTLRGLFGHSDWHLLAEQPAPAHPEGCAALRIVLVTVPRGSMAMPQKALGGGIPGSWSHWFVFVGKYRQQLINLMEIDF